jgi:hypothetical protein
VSTYEYFDVVDYVWWDYFFNSQSDIISSSTNEDTMLKIPIGYKICQMNLKKQTLLKFNKNRKVLLILHKQREEKCILVRKGHMQNVKPWETFTGVEYKILRRIA